MPSEETKDNSTIEPRLAVDIGGLQLRNPVMTASVTFGYGEEYAPFVDLNRLGAVIVKGLSLEPRAGNPPPRLAETPCGMLNAIGLQNIGVKAFIEQKLPFLKDFTTANNAEFFRRPMLRKLSWPQTSPKHRLPSLASAM